MKPPGPRVLIVKPYALGVDSYHNSRTTLILNAAHPLRFTAITLMRSPAIGPERGLKRPKLVG